MEAASSPVWDALFETLRREDPYARETSIHNARVLYNHSRRWITHVSLQGHEGHTRELCERYGHKPVVWDECRYEGDIPMAWGSLTGAEMTDRFWWGASVGAYVGHGETVLEPGVADDAQAIGDNARVVEHRVVLHLADVRRLHAQAAPLKSAL